MAINSIIRRLKGVPYFVCAVLDIVPRAVGFDDHTLHRFFARLGEGGVDYIRIFPFWGKDVLPYRTDPDYGWDLDLWNMEYFTQLRRVVKASYEWRIGIYFDFFDHCGTKQDNKDWNPWYHNRQGINGIYDKNIKYHKEWIKRIMLTVGLRGGWYDKYDKWHKIRPNLFGLGNELNSHGAWDTNKEYHDWANCWGYGLAEYMRTLGYNKEVMFSAEEKTAHALRAYISDDKYVTHLHPNNPFNKKSTVRQYHGWIDKFACEDVVINTTKRKIAYSDDGVNYKNREENNYDGICVKQGDKLKYCSASTGSVKRLCRYIKNNLQHKWQFHHIEQLPRSVSEVGQSLDDLDQHRDVNIYRRIAKSVWGVDIRRKYPRWLYEKHGLKR